MINIVIGRDKMAKKEKNKKESGSKGDKKVVTIKIPSFGIKHVVILLGILLAVSLFFNLRGGLIKKPSGKLSLSGLVYLCPPTDCNTTDAKEWSKDLGYDLTVYDTQWARASVGLLFLGNSSEIVDVSTKANFYTTVCDATQNKKACEVSSAEEKKAAAQSCETMKKKDKPELEAFVVSYCPYGLQMQRILVPVQSLLKDAANIKVRYIGEITNGTITSMHGDQEAKENLKQICIREEQPSKYWDYLACFIKAQGKSDTCSDEVKLDKTKLDSCIKDSNKGLKYAQVDFDAGNKYGVSGSPSLFLNGEQVSEFNFGGRTAEAVKTLVCCGMSTKAKACDTVLNTEQANTAFAATYGSSSGSTGSGAASCG